VDKATVFGIIGGFGCILISIVTAEGGDMMAFVDVGSIFIVFGGVAGAIAVSYPSSMLKTLLPLMKITFKKKTVDLQQDIEMLIEIANIARREGLLALEDAVGKIDSPFLKKGIMLVVDGADPELIKNVMEAEIYFIQDRHAQGQAMLEAAAGYAPAFGMAGTLIGLINMLGNLSDVGSLGPSMATALVTTFYGVLLANLVFNPMARKLKTQTAVETMQKELLLEGLLSIQDGENPRIIRDKLHSFIARRDIKDAEGTQRTKAETGEISNG
jgi:chemotaxis protein MotA